METRLSEMQSLIEKVMMTEGWAKLKPTQQKIIKTSLSVSDRAYRGSAEKRFLDIDAVVPPNAASKRHIASEYCYTAIAALENGKLVTNPHAEEQIRVGENFFDADYLDLTDKPDKVAHLSSHLKTFGYPAVVMPSVNPKIMWHPANHAFLALGGGADGHIYCWDKQGLGLPYRVVTLENEINENKQFDFWGIRKLIT